MANINKRFNIKHWKEGNDTEAVAYLGEEWWRHPDHIEISMHEYIGKLTKYPLAKEEDEEREMTPEEHHDFRSLLQKVRWPVARV
eukprot:1220367-Pyramimonas_sp.AAC.1